MHPSGLHDRLRDVIGNRSYRAVGELTDHNPETVRRYMSGKAPSVEFVAAICHKLDVHADWLLTGRGPVRASEVRAAALRGASPEDLLRAMSSTLEQIVQRVDRVETYVQTLETRVRTRISTLLDDLDGRPAESRPHFPSASLAPRPGRARRSIAGALPPRSRHDPGDPHRGA